MSSASGRTNHTGVLIAVFVVAAGVAALWWYQRHKLSVPRSAVSHREVATRVLAEHLAAQFPAAKILVVANPFTLRRGQDAEVHAFDRAGIRGLEKGFKSPGAIKVVYPELRAEFHQNPQAVFVDPKTTTPLSFLVAEKAFDTLAKENPDRDLIVSLIGLPLNVQQSEVWSDPQKPRFALLLPDWRLVGDHNAIRHAVKSGKIVAAVVNRPGAPPDETPVNADYKTEFDQRFWLVTAENIDQLLQAHPRLF